MITYVIIGLTVVISLMCFSNHALLGKLSMNPYKVIHSGEWYRLITHGFVHADMTHLFVNMFTYWSFGTYIESVFRYNDFGELHVLLLSLPFYIILHRKMHPAQIQNSHLPDPVRP